MAIVEIDETELVNYRNIAGAVQKMLANPATRTKLLEAQKIVNPNAVIPELDSQKPTLDALAAMQKKLDDAEAARLADKAEMQKEKTLAALTSQWEKTQRKARQAGYTAEGLQALEAFMEEKGIADHEIAMPAFEKLNPPSAPVDASGSNRFDLFASVQGAGDDMKMLLEGNENGFTNKRIKETLAGVRSGNL